MELGRIEAVRSLIARAEQLDDQIAQIDAELKGIGNVPEAPTSRHHA